MQDSDLIAKKLASVKLRLFCSPLYIEKHGEITSLKDIEKIDFIEFDKPQASKIIRETLNKEIGQCNIKWRIKSKDYVACIDAATAGAGVIISTEKFIQKELDAGQLVPILKEIVFSEGGGILCHISKQNKHT